MRPNPRINGQRRIWMAGDLIGGVSEQTFVSVYLDRGVSGRRGIQTGAMWREVKS